ncbi:arsenosugar biosynthesis arsenite methyltransferase ArsM [Marinoscillum sp. 108]|uniref:arsenosugar biosynthesis arsenite methyltransferase ArsM n=1 Tax=Marinoscillum sp. 108 TaxID=2653151 RepID=UPI0012EFA231|nr:arsenosugar biosynthesis arsenite methyltransferase ArsM [Marinoscillum sp. 108]VXD19864.1 Methyltransferase family protein [Marinoscillum sp. 108]
MEYLEVTKDIYKQAAITPDVGLCCTTTPIGAFPGLEIPKIMQQMNYGCGSTVHPRDLINDPRILYVGVGGGMELLQFAYFSRQRGGVIGVDIVDEMLEASRKNFKIAEQENPWFQENFVDLRKGDALNLPVEDSTIDVAAQNCLFNIFHEEDLKKALEEMYRVLKPHGRLVLSDPVSESSMPEALKNDPKLRGLCLSGALPLKDYIKLITDAGFGTIEIRAKRPYRILDSKNYDTSETIFIESVEVCAIKDPMPADGPCVFTGKTAIYFGDQEYFDDHNGHVMTPNQPLAVCDKTAQNLAALKRDDIYLSESTYHYDGGGCC